jgi:hypothetical protein
MFANLSRYYKAVVAVVGAIIAIVNEVLPIVPEPYHGYVTSAIAVLTALGVFQVPNKAKAVVARKKAAPHKAT